MGEKLTAEYGQNVCQSIGIEERGWMKEDKDFMLQSQSTEDIKDYSEDNFNKSIENLYKLFMKL